MLNKKSCNKEKKLKVWVLKDHRPGTYLQAINLAKALDISYEIKEISYNILAKLPTFLKFGKFSNIKKKSKDNLLNLKDRPDIIISAGRRSALIALDLKTIYPDLFLIQIMNPGLSIIKKFNLAIVPKHDNISIKSTNIIETIGSITDFSDKNAIENSNEFSDIFAQIKSPKIALLLGGSSKNKKFSIKDAVFLRHKTDEICQNMQASLLVTTSRRTDQFLIDTIKQNNKNIKYFFHWSEDKKNPYQDILKTADYFIVTGDSISMISECCFINKPTYIYTNSRICSKKHQYFTQNLLQLGFAHKLTQDLQKLSAKKMKKLDETSRVLSKIKNSLQKHFL